MDPLTTALVVVLLCILVYRFLWSSATSFEKRGIEYTKPWPILGNMAPILFRRQFFGDYLRNIYFKFQDLKYFGVYNFSDPIIAIRDPELITSIAVKNFDNFTDHIGFVNKDMDPLMGKNLFALRGDRWREMRKLLSPAFTSSKMKSMFKLIIDCAEKTSAFIAEGSKNGRDWDMQDLFRRYTNDVVATTSFGIAVDSLSDPDNEFYKLGRESLNFSAWVSLKIMVGRSFPTISRLFGIKIFGSKPREFFTKIVAETTRIREEKSASSSNNGAGGINLGPMPGGRRLPSQQSFNSSKNHSHHSRHQTNSAPPSTPRNASQLPEIAGRCIHAKSSSRNLVSTKTQQGNTKTLLLISTVFILLNLPSYVIRLCVFFFTLAHKNKPDLLWCLQQFFMLLYYTNFSINFLLYAMCGVTFRRCLQQLMRKVLKSLTNYHCNPQR